MSDDALKVIHDTLAGAGPARLLLVTAGAEPPAGWPGELPGEVLRAAPGDLPAGRFDIAVLFAPAAGFGDARSAALVARLRDRLAGRVLVQLEGAPAALDSAFQAGLALGFVRLAQGDDWLALSFDIDTYNAEREWNNADNWANPENFDRYRW